MRFAYPLALALPIIFLLVSFLCRKKSTPVRFPSTLLTKGIRPSLRLRLRTPTLFALSLLCVAFLTLAAARPQKVSTLRERREARNIMLALDVSGSMQARDFATKLSVMSRLEAVKKVVSEFVQNRAGDRIGLVVFGLKAYLEAPLTFDHELVNRQVAGLQTGIAGDGTAIGDGLGLALKRIEKIKGDSRAVILLTDGVDNVKRVNPVQAAKVAKKLGIKVHTIGIGPSGDLMRFGSRVPFDSETLEKVAKLSGGIYFNANSLESLKDVYAEIDELETTESDEPEHEVVEELFATYALAALLAYAAYILLANSIFMRVP